MLRRLSLIAGLLAGQLALAEAPRHYQLLLGDEPIGTATETRGSDEIGLKSTMKLEAGIERAGVSLGFAIEATHWESEQFEPLRYELTQQLAGSAIKVVGTRSDDGRWSVERSSPAFNDTQQLELPATLKLTRGIERALEQGLALEPGATLELTQLSDDGIKALSYVYKVLGPASVAGQHRLAVSVLNADRSTQLSAELIVDDELETLEQKMRLGGIEMRLVRVADAKVAAADATGSAPDLMAQLLLPAPDGYSRLNRRQPLRYSFRLREPMAELRLPADSPEQRALQLDQQNFQIEVDPNGEMRLPPAIADASLRTPNPYVDANSAPVQSLVADYRDQSDPARQMAALESAVRQAIAHKNLAVGFAAASEALTTASGDCTEHAVALAAAGRALGIPTRVVSGLAYTESFAGQRQVFVPHAWTQALIDGRWLSFDAALNGFDAGHIAFGYGSGEPSDWQQSQFWAGAVELIEVRALASVNKRAGAN